MKRSALSAVLIVCLAGAVLPGALARSAGTAPRIPPAIPPGMDSVQYLPETTVIARVDDRVIRAEEVRTRYYLVSGNERTTTDSLGRLAFLESLVNKEIMGIAAREINPPLEVAQRAALRRVTNRTLQNGLYVTMVGDSIEITEQEIAAVVPQFQYDVRIREMLFEDQASAERVRRDLIRGRITWQEAYRRYSLEPDSGDGSVGWVRRPENTGDVAFRVFTVPVGAISEVYQDQSGFHLVQVLERRPGFEFPQVQMRRMIIRDLENSKAAPRMARMYALARKRVGAAYDSTNLRWVAREFRKDLKARNVPTDGGVLTMTARIPLFSPEDRKRVLVKDRSRQFTVAEFLEGYTAIPPLMRRKILSIEPLIFYVDAMFLEPVLVDLAKERGVDKDPRVVSRIEEQREKLLVERVFKDSILSRVRIDPAEVRAYYDQNGDEFKTKLKVRYAMIMRYDRQGMDSVQAAIKAGAKLEDIIARDRAAGARASLVGELEEGGQNPYGKVLLEELRPGQARMVGPDSYGKYLYIALLERREAGQKPFTEAEPEIRETLQTARADVYLREFLARRREKLRIETHPERMMAIRFSDPMLD